MPKLTNAEQHIIKFPPTKTTWVCQAKRAGEDGVKFTCGSILGGTAPRCWFCGASKPRKPVLLWPKYVAACAKAGIDPEPQGKDTP